MRFRSDSLEIEVSDGPIIQIETHAGAIIPYASDKPIAIDTEAFTGKRNTCAILGFGDGSTFDAPADLEASISIPAGGGVDNHIAFPVPVSGTITSMALFCSVYPLWIWRCN